jgi:hypothetical protein
MTQLIVCQEKNIILESFFENWSSNDVVDRWRLGSYHGILRRSTNNRLFYFWETSKETKILPSSRGARPQDRLVGGRRWRVVMLLKVGRDASQRPPVWRAAHESIGNSFLAGTALAAKNCAPTGEE